MLSLVACSMGIGANYKPILGNTSKWNKASIGTWILPATIDLQKSEDQDKKKSSQAYLLSLMLRLIATIDSEIPEIELIATVLALISIGYLLKEPAKKFTTCNRAIRPVSQSFT